MVVGVLTCSYPRFAGDAAGSFVADDVRRLTERGCAVEVVAAGDGPPGVTRAREGKVTVTRIGGSRLRAGALFYGDGAPETLERPRRARLDPGRAFHGRALPRGASGRVPLGRHREPLAGPLRAVGDRRRARRCATAASRTRVTSRCWNGCPSGARSLAGSPARARI